MRKPGRLPRGNGPILEALEKHAGLVAPAARALGVDRTTLHDRISREPELQAKRDEVRETMLDIAEGHLMNGVRSGDQNDVRYYLRTIGRRRGYGDRTEVVGGDGGPVQVIIDGPDGKI